MKPLWCSPGQLADSGAGRRPRCHPRVAVSRATGRATFPCNSGGHVSEDRGRQGACWGAWDTALGPTSRPGCTWQGAGPLAQGLGLQCRLVRLERAGLGFQQGGGNASSLGLGTLRNPFPSRPSPQEQGGCARQGGWQDGPCCLETHSHVVTAGEGGGLWEAPQWGAGRSLSQGTAGSPRGGTWVLVDPEALRNLCVTVSDMGE